MRQRLHRSQVCQFFLSGFFRPSCREPGEALVCRGQH
jgi:hypothetical protein